MEENKNISGLILIIILCSSLGAIFCFVPRIAQWSSYHQFADLRTLIHIPNFCNVLSNIAFIIVSMLGFINLRKQCLNGQIDAKTTLVFCILFLGIFLTGLGSSYYHWAPNNDTLVWDRIPMTIVFMSLLAFTIMERISKKIGFMLYLPLLAFGIFSVFYWQYTELLGQGDLRPYGIAQLYSTALIFIIIFLFPKPYPATKDYLWMFLFYALAKVCEYYDFAIYHLTADWISGHTLKHLFSALSIYWAVVMLKKYPKN